MHCRQGPRTLRVPSMICPSHGDEHWCDDFIYKAILAPVANVLESKESCIEIVGDFVNEAYGDAVAEALCEM
ncbi:hypothetical protein SUGI_0947720 [Cryptomeria japonica]|nr:hypothetical protein SUGI_0947720 [Cryptomeria japonica]